jgi:hypothetical protein
MDERTHAIRILQKTREILARRLTERILEAEEEILAEAEGHSFFSEIETIYDQIGLRLAHVNQMLAHLPAPAETSPRQGKPSAWPDDLGNGAEPPTESRPTAAESRLSSFLALPAPAETRTGITPLASSTLLVFAVQVRRGDVEGAALSLESLFGLTRERALASARVVHSSCTRDPAFIENAALLQNYLQADALSRAFGQLCENFGLSGSEALSALMWWRTRAVR